MKHQDNHEMEVTECRECGVKFDLANQPYYDDRCPKCMDEKRTWPPCGVCGGRVPPNERATTVVGGTFTPSERVVAHKRCA
jgi:hypothetical protein